MIERRQELGTSTVAKSSNHRKLGDTEKSKVLKRMKGEGQRSDIMKMNLKKRRRKMKKEISLKKESFDY